MPQYKYKVVDFSGNVMKGSMEAEDLRSFYMAMHDSELYVISVSEREAESSGPRLFKRKIKRKDVIELSNNLSVMINAGIPVLTALDDIVETAETVTVKEVIMNIKRNVTLGSTLSDAVESERGAFPDIFVRLIKVGEETGSLAKSLSDVAEHLQRIEDLMSALKRALIYPAFAFTSTMGAMLFWLIFVLPKMMELFVDMGIKIPPTTRFLIIVSNFSKNYWYVLVSTPIILFILYKFLQRFEKVRFYIDLAKIRLPILKLIVYNMLIALFAEQMRILLVAGITINRSLELIQETIGNVVFSKAFARVHDLIMSGTGFADSIKRQNLFPMMVIRMIAIGEASGGLDDQFGFLAEHFLKRLDDISEKMSKILEPVVMIFVGGMFAVIIVGLFSPIYDLVAGMGKQ